jgi:hypothetical protein
MALEEKLRSSIYRKLVPMLGEEESAAMLAHFPARDVEEPATKEFIRAELAELRTELKGDTGDLRTSFAGLEGTMHKLANRVLVAVLGLVVAWAATAIAVAVKVG